MGKPARLRGAEVGEEQMHNVPVYVEISDELRDEVIGAVLHLGRCQKLPGSVNLRILVQAKSLVERTPHAYYHAECGLCGAWTRTWRPLP